MRIVFMGTPDFAVPSLDMLVKEGYEVVAAVTQPDKPQGRGKKIAPHPVTKYAIENGIKLLQPAKIKTQEFAEEIRALQPDLIITVAYGKILPDYFLNIPSLGCINVHGSLLPKHRGAAPIQWSILEGDTVTGITTMYMDVGIDTGDMLLKEEVEIPGDMTAGELFDKLSIVGARTLKKTLEQLKEGTLQRTPQRHEEATFTTMLTKEMGLIDWNKTAREIHNRVRGTNPQPGAYTFYKGERLRMWKTSIADEAANNDKPGTICEVSKSGIVTATGKGLLVIKELQADSSRRMTVDEYIRGHSIDEGEILG